MPNFFYDSIRLARLISLVYLGIRPQNSGEIEWPRPLKSENPLNTWEFYIGSTRVSPTVHPSLASSLQYDLDTDIRNLGGTLRNKGPGC